MPVTMICPNLSCRKTVVVPESARGKLVRCAHCNQLFRVPMATGGKNGAGVDEREPQEERSDR
jgi:hypothetical protein